MTMRKILPFITALIIGVGLSLQPVEAKRLGSGQSLGKQKQSFSREAAPPSAPANATGAATTGAAAGAAAGGASKWMGPLAGLAAGGLLAALFFGGAFEGIQIMDILVIALLAFGILMLFRMLRAKPAQARQQGAYAYATAAAAPQGVAQAPNPAPGGAMPSSPGALKDAPAWFDENGFLQGARQHFLTLQLAWDANDMQKVREYFTPELFEQLRAQREALGDAASTTDVQSLHAQLLDLAREGDQIIASVLFQGRVREDGGPVQDFAEIWHVQHAADTPQGDWLISGIQQTEPKGLQ